MIQQALGQDRWAGTHRLLPRPVELIRLARVRADHRQAVVDAVSTLDTVRPPHTARIHDLLPDPDEEDGLWLVQERLADQTLDAAIRSGSLPAEAARALCQAVLPALAALHDSRHAHGDLSPARIRLTDRGPILTGFVTARVDTPSEQHLAPELWSRRSPSPTSDVYAFGVCLYEALTSTPPFPRGLPRGEYGRLHQNQGVPDLAARRPDLPPDLLRVVQQATQISPKARPRTARALLNLLDNTPTPATRPPVPAPAPEPAPAPAPAPEPAPVQVPVAERPSAAEAGSDRRWLVLPLATGAGLVLAAACGLGATTLLGPSGLSGLLHDGPRITVDNPTGAEVTVACSAGPERVRVGAILEPGEAQTLLLAGAPADCIAFTSDKAVQMRWRGEEPPAEGAPWTATVGEGLPDPAEPVDTGTEPDQVLLELLPSAEPEDTGGEEDGGGAVAAARPAPRPQPRPQPAAAEPEPAEPAEPVGLRVTVDDRRRLLARNIDVYVDGEQVGEAPVTWAVTPGSHTVRWVKSGRVDHTCTVEVGADGGAIQLDPSAPACPGEAPPEEAPLDSGLNAGD